MRKSYYPELKKRLEDLERFKTLLDQSNDAIFLVEIPSGRLTDLTRSACRQIGYQEGVGPVKTLYDIIPDRPEELEQLFSGKKSSLVLDARIARGNGDEAYFEINLRRVRFGDEDYAIAVARDVTQRKQTEESLRLTQFTLDKFSDSAIWISPEGRIVYVNETACSNLGYSREQLQSMCIWQIDHNYGPEKYKQAWEEIRREGTLKFESEHVTLSGRKFPVEVTCSYIRYSNKEYMVSTDRDITERKQAEDERERLMQEIDSQRRRLQVILDNLPVTLYVLDTNGRTVLANRLARNKHGGPFPATLEEFEKGGLWWADTGKPVKISDSGLGRALQNGESSAGEVMEVGLPDGSSFTIMSSVAPLFDTHGNITGAMVISQDITEMRKLGKDRKRLIHDLGERVKEIRALNEAYEIIQKGRPLTETLQEIVNILPSAWQYPEVTAARILLNGQECRTSNFKESPWVQRSGFHTSYGQYGAIEVCYIEKEPQEAEGPFLADERTILDTLAEILRTYLDKRYAEEALIDAKNQAELYLDLMGHDITNMNQALLGYLELIESMRDSGHIDKSLIDNAIEIINRSTRMIDDVKKITQLRSEEAPLKKVDLCAMLETAKARHSIAPGRSVTFNYAHPGKCPVWANDMLTDVLGKLIDNTIRHSTGAVTIDLAVDRVALDGTPYYRVTVADNGPGIPPDLKKTIFLMPEEFREKAIRRGFGMYLVRTLIDYYHGQVWVEDRVPGDYAQGAKFIVLLPQAD